MAIRKLTVVSEKKPKKKDDENKPFNYEEWKKSGKPLRNQYKNNPHLKTLDRDRKK